MATMHLTHPLPHKHAFTVILASWNVSKNIKHTFAANFTSIGANMVFEAHHKSNTATSVSTASRHEIKPVKVSHEATGLPCNLQTRGLKPRKLRKTSYFQV